MHPKLLDYYSREIAYMRDMGAEFARRHPEVASRLGMQGITVEDPYVERMIEAFCFLTARTQLKLDAEFPSLTQRLLEVLYPNYVAPTPSMAVVRMVPEALQGHAMQGYTVPRNTAFRAGVAAGEQTACEFRSSRDVTLWPLDIVSATLGDVPPDLPPDIRARAAQRNCAGALVLRVRMTAEAPLSSLATLDRLPLFIGGEEVSASHLFELVHTAHAGIVVRLPGSSQGVMIGEGILHDSMAPEQALLPQAWHTFQGHRLLQEYFACPQVFRFLTLAGLRQAMPQMHGSEMEVIVLLDRLDTGLATHVHAGRFQLFCTPVINLFARHSDRITLNRAQVECHVVPDRTRPLDYEVHAISRVYGHRPASAEAIAFSPMYQARHGQDTHRAAFFSVRREQRILPEAQRRHGMETPYSGTEVFVSLVDQQHAPYSDDIRYLSADMLVTNRDLPCQLRDGDAGLSVSDALPVGRVAFVIPPSLPRPLFAQGEAAWRLIRQLGFNYAPLHDMPDAEGAAVLRQMLRLFLPVGDPACSARIDSLVGVRTRPVTSRLPGNGLLAYGRGVRCTLTVDEAGFSGGSPYLFGLVMERYMARHVAINVFAQTELCTLQRGRIACWAPRMGQRGGV